MPRLTEEQKKKNLVMGRTETGRFKKGQSGNMKGRPKKKPIPDVDNTQFKNNPMEALLYLLNNATSEAEVFKYAKELMPYCKPKLSSIQSEIKQEKTVTIHIEGFQPLEVKNGNNAKVIEGEALSIDELEAIKTSKLEKVKK